MKRTKRGEGPKGERQGRGAVAHALDSGESGQPGAEDLPPAPGPDATAEEWRAWGEAMHKAGKLGVHTSGDG